MKLDFLGNWKKRCQPNWATSARFQETGKPCLLCSECDGLDSSEHYAKCLFQWRAFASQFPASVYQNSLPRFLGLLAESENDKVFHACHIYAVMSAFDSRKHAGIITDFDSVSKLIWQGHRTAQCNHKGLEKGTVIVGRDSLCLV